MRLLIKPGACFSLLTSDLKGISIDLPFGATNFTPQLGIN